MNLNERSSLINNSPKYNNNNNTIYTPQQQQQLQQNVVKRKQRLSAKVQPLTQIQMKQGRDIKRNIQITNKNQLREQLFNNKSNVITSSYISTNLHDINLMINNNNNNTTISSTSTSVNPDSHHVRTTKERITKNEKINKQEDNYKIFEQQLISSIQINQMMENDIHNRILTAYKAQSLQIPIIAFLKSYKQFVFVKNYNDLKMNYDIEHLNQPIVIDEKQLSLDLYNFDKEYSTIASIIVYLKNMKNPLTFIIARHHIAFTNKAIDLFTTYNNDYENDDILVDNNNNNKEDDVIVTTVKMTSDSEINNDSITTVKMPSITSNNTKIKTTTISSSTITTAQAGVKTKTKLETTTITQQYDELSFMDRILMNLSRTRQEGYYYMIYIDLALSPLKKNDNIVLVNNKNKTTTT